MKKIQISFTVPHTPDNQEALGFFAQWSASIPTLFFLDLCTISHIKAWLQQDLKGTVSEPPSIKFLRRNDVAHNAISYLPALMEKSSDMRSNFTTHGLLEEARRDLNALQSFFKSARVYETAEFAEQWIRELKGIHVEKLGPSYHEFLDYLNALQLFNKISPAKRIDITKAICGRARDLKISNAHPVVLIAIACIYGCVSAMKVMKFKRNPKEFSSSNALGDIQAIQRVGKLTQLVAPQDATPGGFVRTSFVTDDGHLRRLYKFFFVNEVTESKHAEFAMTTFQITVKANKLFPDLYGPDNELKGEAQQLELMKIQYLLGLPVEEIR